MKCVRTGVLFCLGALAVIVAACSGKGEENPLFDPEDADDLAHDAVLGKRDLPGNGWTVIGTDQFGDGEEEEDEFDAAMKSIPECKEVREAGLFIEDDDKDPAGRAQVEFERETGNEMSLGVNVEMQVEIFEKISEVEADWDRAKGMFANGKAEKCMVAALNEGFAQSGDMEGLEARVESIRPLAPAPEGGAVVAMRMEISAGELFTLKGLMHFYVWPNSNAGISLSVMGDEGEVTEAFLREVVKAAEEKVKAAAK